VAGGTHGGLRAADVDVDQRRRVGRAEGVHAGHVEGERAALHPAGHHVLVQRVAADHARAAGGQRPLGRVRAHERDDLVPALDQPPGERAAHETAAAGQEDARHAFTGPGPGPP
jgi:hypothetical protein